MKPTQIQQFTTEQTTLAKALKTCSVCLSDNRIMPAYEMFKFAITSNTLSISACDGMASITTSIPIQSEISDFALLVPGKKFADYISKSANEILIFDIETYVIPEMREIKQHPISGEDYEAVTPERITYSLVVKSSRNKSNQAKFPCDLGDSFPTIVNNPTGNLSLKAEDLNEILYKTMFAVSDDQLRPAGTGINFVFKGGKITGTATNWHLISSISIDSDIDFEANIIIPKKTLQQLQSLNPSGEIMVSASDSSITFRFAEIELTSLLIHENFPEWLRLVPEANEIYFVTSRTEMIISLKRILPMSDMLKLVKLDVSASSITLTAENIDYSEGAKESIPGALANGDPITIGARGSMLLDILNSFVNDEVWFSFGTPKTAMILTDVVKHVNPGKENLVVFMPLFLS